MNMLLIHGNVIKMAHSEKDICRTDVVLHMSFALPYENKTIDEILCCGLYTNFKTRFLRCLIYA